MLSSRQTFNDLLLALVDNIEKDIPNHTHKVLHKKKKENDKKLYMIFLTVHYFLVCNISYLFHRFS